MEKTNYKHLLSYTLVGIFGFLLLVIGVVIYESNKPPVETISISPKADEVKEATTKTPWQDIYPLLSPMQIGSTSVKASVAATWPDRIKGLSDTPYLPEEVVKFFVFDSMGFHSIWMKDMNYAIDIIWLDEDGRIVHLVEGAAPESFPAYFVPKQEAKYVVETVDGFIAKNEITLNSSVTLPKY